MSDTTPDTTPMKAEATETTRTAQIPQSARIADLLAEEGYRPHVEEGQGGFRSVFFKAEGARFLVRLNEADPGFIAICLGYRFAGETLPEAAVLRAGHDVQTELKVVKFYVDLGRTYYEFGAEIFVDERPLTPALLERCLGTLRRACHLFHERLREKAPTAQA